MEIQRPVWDHGIVPAICCGFFFVTALHETAIAQEIPFPLDEWDDHGIVLSPSDSGWDCFTTDGFGVGGIVKKDGVYYLYYTGSSGPRVSDGGPADRAIGVATSVDGASFTKHENNPIITHQPSVGHENQEEEGCITLSVTLGDGGDFVIYYGALTANGSTSVQSDIHLSTSSDGLNFTDHGVVIPNTVDGGGDEVWPVGLLHAQGGSSSLTGEWHVWYETDGFGERHISLATGETRSGLTPHAGNPVIKDEDLNIIQSTYLFSSGEVWVFLVEGPGWDSLEPRLRTTTTETLDTYSAPVPLAESMGELFADFEHNLWRRFFRDVDDDGNITCRLKTASFGGGGPLGAPCENGFDCESGYCVDGLCCDSQCEGVCKACDLAESLGFCSPVPDDTSCSDADLCNGDEVCLRGECMPGEALDCRTTNPCAVSFCDPQTGCAEEQLADGYECGESMHCISGECVEVSNSKDGGCSCMTSTGVAGGQAGLWLLLLLAVLRQLSICIPRSTLRSRNQR